LWYGLALLRRVFGILSDFVDGLLVHHQQQGIGASEPGNFDMNKGFLVA
jgi:hypothetical protein